MTSQQLSERIQDLISRSGLLPTEIERRSGLSNSTLLRLIADPLNSRITTITKLERVLGPILSVAIPRGPHSPKAKQRTLDESANRLSGKITNVESLPGEALIDFDRLLDSD